MRVAAYQAPLLSCGSPEAIAVVSRAVARCEVIRNDSNFSEPAKSMAARGATVIFVLTNNALPPERADVFMNAQLADVASAKALGVFVVRADVAGRVENRVSFGSSVIVDPHGTIIRSARRLEEDWLVADIAKPQIGIE